MSETIYELAGARVMELVGEGVPLRTGRDATDLIGDASGREASVVAVPVARMHEDFFRLRTGVAGEFTQKFVTYGVRLVIVGDIERYLAESEALRDFVVECNSRDEIWFVRDREEMHERIRTRVR